MRLRELGELAEAVEEEVQLRLEREARGLYMACNREWKYSYSAAERREYLKKIPSGPVEPVDLPKAALHVRKRIVAVPSDAETTFGTRRGVGVQLMVRGVSREHAKIRPEPAGYVLYDLMSPSGTFVGEERVERKVLADGEVFRVGPVEILFRLGDAPREE